MNDLKLYVLGEISGNPDDWSEYGHRAFVLARSSEEALALDDGLCHVAEVQASKPVILCYEFGSGEF